MAVIDFGGGFNPINNDPQGKPANQETEKPHNDGGGSIKNDVVSDDEFEDPVDINTGQTGTELTDINNTTKDNNTSLGKDPVEKVEHEYEVGTIFEIDDQRYTIATNGDLINDKGEVFKAANEVAEYFKGFDVEDDKGEDPKDGITIDSVIKGLGVELVDENNKAITFDNTPDGINAYLSQASEKLYEEGAKFGVEDFLKEYPFVRDQVNYYLANGKSLDGWKQETDYSTIELDKDNKEQLIAIIKESARVFDKKGNIDNYIKYLENSDTLFDTAKEELNALNERSNEIKAQTEKAAQEAVEAEKQRSEAYWKGVKEIIDGGKIGDYKLPNNIIVEKDGKKVSYTSKDFFNYLYVVDKNGESRYMKDLANLSSAVQLNNDLLNAYFMFTGGSYNDLVKLAVNEAKVKTLRRISADNSARVVKVTPPNGQKGEKVDIAKLFEN